MGPDGPREHIADALARLGCELREYSDGTYCVDCPSHLAKTRCLDLLAWRDARFDPRVRHYASAIAQDAKTNAAHKVDPLDLATKLHQFVTKRVRYLGEGPEIFQRTTKTLDTGMGDCDDSTRALLALARSVAIPARLVVFDVSKDLAGDDLAPNHATVQLSADRGKTWHYAETSLGPGVHFGEHPIAAAKRLKRARAELGGNMGGVGDRVGNLLGIQAFPSYPDSELGTLPDVPGLRARVNAEPGFARALLQLLKALNASDTLVSLISEESGFDPAAYNPVSGTVGFMQWMPRFFPDFFGSSPPTPTEVRLMSGLGQLNLIYSTVQRVPAYLTDPAMAGWGAHVGEPDATVIASKGEIAYTQNSGYDKEGKGYITAGDVRRAVLGPLAASQGKTRIGPTEGPWFSKRNLAIALGLAGAGYVALAYTKKLPSHWPLARALS